MVITESLAKGLRADFWQYLESENEKLLGRVSRAASTPAGDLTNTKRANLFFRKLDSAASSQVVLHKEITGRRQHAVWWSIYLAEDESHRLDTWNERALRFECDRVSAYPQHWNPTWLTTIIGEHCVARLFQRLPWSDVPSPKDVFPELRELAKLIVWYQAVDSVITGTNPGLALSAFIPTTNGAFLGIHNPLDAGITELRTFIGRHQMTDGQRSLWDALRNASKLSPLDDHLGQRLRTEPGASSTALVSCAEAILAMTNALIAHRHLLSVEAIQEQLRLELVF